MKALNEPILTSADLDAAWRDLAGPWGYSVSRVWILLIDALGHVTQVVDITDESPGERPDATYLENLVAILTDTMDETIPGGSVAAMRARPGTPATRPLDDVWCRALHEALQSAPFRTWPVYFSTDTSVDPVAPDVLVGTAQEPDSA